MSAEEIRSRLSKPTIEDWLRPGADAQEFVDSVNTAVTLRDRVDMFERRSVAYAWECGRELIRIKSKIRYGYWMKWKNAAEFASERKMSLYVMIAEGFESAEEASAASSTIAGAAAIITERRKAQKEGRTATKLEEASAEEKTSLALNAADITEAIAESETAVVTYRHKTGADGFAECGGDGLLLSEQMDEVDCPDCLIVTTEVPRTSVSQSREGVARQQGFRDNGRCSDHPDEQYMMDKYDMTCPQWHAMFDEQGRACYICKSEHPRGRVWHIDHDHRTGHVRGILCIYCNTHLDWYEKYKQKILDYLDR